MTPTAPTIIEARLLSQLYDLIDREPGELSLPQRFTWAALRVWTQSLRADRSPVAPLDAFCAQWGAPGALWPAHALFYWVVAHARRCLHLGCPSCGRDSEDEALLIAAVFAARDEQRSAQAALCDLVLARAVPRGALLARKLGAEVHRLSFAKGPTAFARNARREPG